MSSAKQAKSLGTSVVAIYIVPQGLGTTSYYSVVLPGIQYPNILAT